MTNNNIPPHNLSEIIDGTIALIHEIKVGGDVPIAVRTLQAWMRIAEQEVRERGMISDDTWKGWNYTAYVVEELLS